ncbi:MAG: DUF4169 family protein [Fulvimarina manganoxydans]|uniref:DUF4169 family protein n=1 Tax=Fulvimarina manganoxydans TaxID=937218 RepID=UPI002354DD5D|nr:DUF4169 family protein [Fulvimarina manganoxydans]MCK5934453.1 DUF4169 family protein [Fulvimarina manganoxydans]
MAEIVNLRQARKRRDRQIREAEADANRARHGQSKPEKTRRANEQATAEAHLDGHRLDRTKTPPSDSSS